VRFVLDHDIDAAVRKVILAAGHECWTVGQAGLFDATDDALSVYADDKQAALVTHDEAFSRRRQKRCFGQHVWLRCDDNLAVEVIVHHLPEIVSVLAGREAVVLQVTATNVRPLSSRWS
jgi:predicted nuclease of predicted toxin-antitoxin system